MRDVTTLDAAAVRRLLSPAAARASQREAFLALHRGTGTAPPRAVLPIGDGYTFCYPARHAPDAGAVVKIGSFTPENPARGLPAVSATVLVLGPVDGRLRALLDGTELTTLRTAAASALAVETLAPDVVAGGTAAPAVVAVLGSGVQGRAHVDAVLDVLPGAALRLWGRTVASVDAWAEGVRHAWPGSTVMVAPTPAQAVAGADVVLCCTSAHEPLFALDDLAERALVVSVGSVAPDRREVPATLVDGARLVVDSPADCAATCGPVLDAVARGALDPGALTGLGAVLDGSAPHDGPAGRTLHLSLGVGLQDAAAAWAVLRAHDAERARGEPRR